MGASRALTECDTLDAGLRACLDLIGPAVGSTTGGISLWDESVAALQVAALFGPPVPPEAIAAINAAYRARMGDLMGLSVFESGTAFYIEDVDAVETPFKAVLDRQRAKAIAVHPLKSGVKPIGTLAFAFGRARAFTAEDRHFLEMLTGLVGHWVDSLKRTVAAEDERDLLLRVDAMKDEFLGTLSHELRTPINAITGMASILEDGVYGQLPPDQSHCVGRILSAADTLRALVDQLLDATHIRAGKLVLQRTHLEFGRLAKDALALFQAQAAEKGIALSAECEPDLPILHVDGLRIGQVISNLVGNAIKFSPGPGTVTIRARADESGFTCEVADQGIGIPEIEIPRLFDRFTQLDMSATRTAGGLGLGLAIVKSLVEAHGGDIGAHSTVGAGSTFWFTLPPEALSLGRLESASG